METKSLQFISAVPPTSTQPFSIIHVTLCFVLLCDLLKATLITFKMTFRTFSRRLSSISEGHSHDLLKVTLITFLGNSVNKSLRKYVD